MTRRSSVRQSVLTARSSFWEKLPQDAAAKTEVRRAGSVSERAPGLYDQLVHLKDWTEETAELCSEARREDSAMRLSSGTRPSLSSSVSRSNSGTAARASKSSSQGIRFPSERSFCRSSFSAARPYETRKPRQRPRTFAMEELDPKNCFAVCLEEVKQPLGTGNQQLPAVAKKQNSLLTMAVSSLNAADDMLRSIMKSALYQTTGHLQSAT